MAAPDAGTRLDAFLATRLPDLSRSRAARLIEDGAVRVNREPARKSYPVEAGDRVELLLPEPTASGVAAEPIPLRIIHQDEHLAVVDKPAGLVVHPAPGNRTGTMVNALLHHLDDLSGIGGVLRPGIVHRLDRDTSGLLVVAKTDAAHRGLAGALKRREIERSYLIVAWGHLAEEELLVDAPIGRSPRERKRMAVVEGGRQARTRFRVLERWRAADLIRAHLETGRTHQIRVHLAHIGHPVGGDVAFGGGGARRVRGRDRRWAFDPARRVPRQFLHAAELAFLHPVTGLPLRFSAPLPAALEDAAQWARESSTPAQ
ncbi:MAG: RluA family pseudouridine synthase [Gemmatimonadota bacterium]